MSAPQAWAAFFLGGMLTSAIYYWIKSLLIRLFK
jgi:hypothetical protein